MFRSVKLIATLFIACILQFSCSKKDTPRPTPPPVDSTPPQYPPTITTFVITDYCQRKITVTGTHFISDVSQDSIFFGRQKGIIDSASYDQIFARFPSGYLSGTIKIFCKTLSVTSSSAFVWGPPSITSFSPETAGPGTIITINGENFNANYVADSVYFGNLKARILSASSTEITAAVPKGASSGPIKVYSNCLSATSSGSFKYSNKGVVYVNCNARYSYAVDIASGSIVWKKYLNAAGLSGATYDDGIVYIGSTDVNNLDSNYMYAIDGLTGDEIWKFHAGPWDMIPAINNGVLYAGAFDKKFYALNAKTGEKLWSFTGGDYFRSAGPTYYNGNIYSRNDDGYLYSLNAQYGTMNWRLNIFPTANPAVSNGTLYVVGVDLIYALDPATGDIKWKYYTGSLNGSSPTIANGVLYIVTNGHLLIALNAMTGDLIWKIEVSWFATSAVAVADNIVYASISDGSLYAVDATNGNILWIDQLTPNFLVGFSPVVANGMLYIGDYGGLFYAIDAKTGMLIWKIATGGYPVMASPCVVDENGNVFHAGDSGNQQ